MKWCEPGSDYFDPMIKKGAIATKEIWWGLRMNEVERAICPAMTPRLSST